MQLDVKTIKCLTYSILVLPMQDFGYGVVEPFIIIPIEVQVLKGSE